jgi:hypothetical protein
MRLVTAAVTAVPRAVHRHIFLETSVFGQLAGWSPPPQGGATATLSGDHGQSN